MFCVPLNSLVGIETLPSMVGVARSSGSQSVAKISHLPEAVLDDWRSIREKSSIYRSPFYSPEFNIAVDRVSSGVEVGFSQVDGRVQALLPFARHGNQGKPVGVGVNDAHGFIADQTLEPFCVAEFLKTLGIQSFAFHASHPDSFGTAEAEIGRTKSFLADLTIDPDGYEQFLRKRNRTIEKQGQKSRKLARQEGELRFEFDCRDPDLIRWLISKKRIQYQRTHTFDIFSVAWIRNLLFELNELPQYKAAEEVVAGTRLRGILSVLYAGKQPVAAHYGMVEDDLLHYWFPVYAHEYHYGSPGTQLFLDVAREAAARGFTAIDMGYGEQPYKYKLTNLVTEMSHGILGSSQLGRLLSKAGVVVRERVKTMRLRNQLKPLARKVMPWIGQGKYTP